MTTWFTHGFLRLGKKRAQSLDDSGDKENSGPHYPTMKKGARQVMRLFLALFASISSFRPAAGRCP